MQVKIKSPVEGYNGISANVTFVNGEAQAEISASTLDWFIGKGYFVEILKSEKTVKSNTSNPSADDEADAEKAKLEAEAKAKAEKDVNNSSTTPLAPIKPVMSRADLVVIALAEGVIITDDMNRNQVYDAIKSKREAK
jgi:hypothetical protein